VARFCAGIFPNPASVLAQ